MDQRGEVVELLARLFANLESLDLLFGQLDFLFGGAVGRKLELTHVKKVGQFAHLFVGRHVFGAKIRVGRIAHEFPRPVREFILFRLSV